MDRYVLVSRQVKSKLHLFIIREFIVEQRQRNKKLLLQQFAVEMLRKLFGNGRMWQAKHLDWMVLSQRVHGT